MSLQRHRRPPLPSTSNQSDGGPPPPVPEWLERVRLTVEHEAPLMRTLMMRAIDAVLQFNALSEDSAQSAATAPTNFAVLLRALSSGEILADLRSVEPLAPAFIRGIEAKRRLVEGYGGALSAEEVANTLGITRQAVDKRRRAGKLLGLTTGRYGYRYPAWQFTESGVVPGLPDVLAVLAPHDEWMQAAFFVGENPRLGGKKPIDLLKGSKLEAVLNAAEAYGEHGAA
jgi:hypothetical protein